MPRNIGHEKMQRGVINPIVKGCMCVQRSGNINASWCSVPFHWILLVDVEDED